MATNIASTTRESAVFAEAVQATGLTILELRCDPHLLWLAIRQRGALQRFDVDALFYRLQRVHMQAGESLRDVADRIEKLASQYSMSFMLRLQLTTDIAG